VNKYKYILFGLVFIFGCEKYDEGGSKDDGVESRLINTYWNIDSMVVYSIYTSEEMTLRFLRETDALTPVYVYRKDTFLSNCEGSWSIINDNVNFQLTFKHIEETVPGRFDCFSVSRPAFDNVWIIKKYDDGELKLYSADTISDDEINTYELILKEVESSHQ